MAEFLPGFSVWRVKNRNWQSVSEVLYGFYRFLQQEFQSWGLLWKHPPQEGELTESLHYGLRTI